MPGFLFLAFTMSVVGRGGGLFAADQSRSRGWLRESAVHPKRPVSPPTVRTSIAASSAKPAAPRWSLAGSKSTGRSSPSAAIVASGKDQWVPMMVPLPLGDPGA
jgi:hypothetical protein